MGNFPGDLNPEPGKDANLSANCLSSGTILAIDDDETTLGILKDLLCLMDSKSIQRLKELKALKFSNRTGLI